MRSLSHCIAIALMAASSGCESSAGDGLCSLLGPCGDYSGGPIAASVIVGFPDSLVSTDPTNQVGIVRVGTTISLRYVRATSGGPSGRTLEQAACGANEVLSDTLRWAVSDSAVAAISGGAGRATLRAVSTGTFIVLTTTIPSGTVDSRLWLPYVIACPSGRGLNVIRVVQ